jgi:hypothetical protein
VSRPSEYTQETALTICERLICGESLRAICRDESMPGLTTVMQWLSRHAEFAVQYAHARDAQADTLADEILEICDDGTNDWMERLNREGKVIGWSVNGEAVQRSRLRVDTRKWFASKLKPKKYGDKLTLDGAVSRGADALTDDELSGIACRGGAGASSEASRTQEPGELH